jgi:xanthine dehydrogenase accessory factor
MNDIFGRISALQREGKLFALATVVSAADSTPRGPGTRMIVFPDGSSEGTIGGGAIEKRVIEDALSSLKSAQPGTAAGRFNYDLGKGEEGVPLDMACGGKVEVLIEVFGGGIKVFIFGAGHVGKTLARVCGVLGIPHWVIDNRDPYARRELFPGAAGVLHADFRESFSRLPIDENSCIVIVTYGHKHDDACLEEALKTKAAYIGMIGSKNKVRTLLGSLSKRGAAVSDGRVFAPIGLHLGDSSPEQISISILSEILKVRSGGSGRHMRDLL